MYLSIMPLLGLIRSAKCVQGLKFLEKVKKVRSGVKFWKS